MSSFRAVPWQPGAALVFCDLAKEEGDRDAFHRTGVQTLILE
jgi:hypothetical protein